MTGGWPSAPVRIPVPRSNVLRAVRRLIPTLATLVAAGLLVWAVEPLRTALGHALSGDVDALEAQLQALGVTGALILSLARIAEWQGQLAIHGIAGWADLTWRIGLIAALHFAWPLALLYVVLKVPYWTIISLYQPDLIIWLEAMAAGVSLKGLLEIALAWRVYWQIH